MIRRRADDWRYFARAEAATDALLARALGIEKAAPRILTRPGFDGVVRRLIGELTHVTGTADAAAIRTAAKKLDRRWDKMPAAERERVIQAAAEGLRDVPKVVVPKVAEVLRGELPGIVQAAKAATGTAVDAVVARSLNAQDQKIVDFAANSQGSYITDQYGVRATAYEQQARTIVADGLEEGLGREEISERLTSQLSGAMLGRASSYWDQVASIHVARARSYGQMAAYTEAGIEKYTISAARDEVTCVICRLMNGKTFTVGSSMQSFLDVESSGDPKAVEDEQPFIKVGRTDEGARFLYAESYGTTHMLAHVISDATGERNDDGRYGKVAPPATFETAGCQTPPFHGRCRCLTTMA